MTTSKVSVLIIVSLALLALGIIPPVAGSDPGGPPDPNLPHIHKMFDESFGFRHTVNDCHNGLCTPIVGLHIDLVKWNGISWISSPVVSSCITDSNGFCITTTSEENPGIYFYKATFLIRTSPCGEEERVWYQTVSAHILTPELAFNQTEYTDLSQGVTIFLADNGLNSDPNSVETANITLESIHFKGEEPILDKVYSLYLREGDMFNPHPDSSLFTGTFSFTTNLSEKRKIYVSGFYPGKLRVRNADNSLEDLADYQFPPSDLNLTMDYKRDLTRYAIDYFIHFPKKNGKYEEDLRPTDNKTVYGGDMVIFRLEVTNEGPNNASGIIVNELLPEGLEFAFYQPSIADYDNETGDWNIKRLNVDDSVKLEIHAKVVNDQDFETTAIIKEPTIDADLMNNQATVKFTAKPPVIFVHGWRGTPETWIDFRKAFLAAGIKSYYYNYSPALIDPEIQSFAFEYWIEDKIRGQDNYQGRFNIVCHSMGALVSRIYIEANSKNAESVCKWIGIAPVNHGAALADLEQLFPDKSLIRRILIKIFPDLKKDTGAIVNMRTDDNETLNISLNSRGKAAGIEYTVIMGRLGTYPVITPIDITSWNRDLKNYLLSLSKGTNEQTLIMITENDYGLTWYGDGVVANYQSELECAIENKPILGQRHNSICHYAPVIDEVKNRLYGA